MNSRTKLLFVTFLTVVRVPLVLLFFAGALLYARNQEAPFFFASLASLILSAVTDMFDGYYARKLKVVTNFGAHADPLMDKFYYVVSLPLLVFLTAHNHHLRHALALLLITVLFLARDQWVTFLRSVGSMHNVSGGANWSGKLRTIINFPVICAIYYFEEAPAYAQFFAPWFIYLFEIIAVAITIISLYVYTKRYWPCLIKSFRNDDK